MRDIGGVNSEDSLEVQENSLKKGKVGAMMQSKLA
jgi:hypothetical protein